MCIGELNKISKENTELILKKQIDEAFNGLSINSNDIIIAYEPVWSIGSGIIPDEKYLIDTIYFIKNYIKNNYKINIKVLYGGSVNVDNIDFLKQIKEIDGFLIGSSSLNPNNILEITKKLL